MRGKSVYTPPEPLELHGLHLIVIDGCHVSIRLRMRTRRRTRVMLSYHPDGILFVDAPAGTTERTLRILLFRSEEWLRKEIRKFKNNDHVVYPSSYKTGSKLCLLGEALKLQVRESKNTTVTQTNGTIRVSAPKHSSVQSIVHDWYGVVANSVLNESVRRICNRTSLLESVPQWSHRYMSSRWGSCSSHGTMRLNTHLVKVPQDAIDMVVLHELCHFTHLNHSKAFYSLMATHMPDWKQHDNTLKRFHRLLQEEFE